MKASDYFCPDAKTSTLGYNLGRSARAIRTGTIIEAFNPLKASAAVGVASGGISALVNTKKYKEGRITKRDAVLDTAGESVGMGLSAGLGLLASNAVRASIFIASTTSVVPFVLGVVVTSSAKIIWDCTIKKHFKCE